MYTLTHSIINTDKYTHSHTHIQIHLLGFGDGVLGDHQFLGRGVLGDVRGASGGRPPFHLCHKIWGQGYNAYVVHEGSRRHNIVEYIKRCMYERYVQ